MAINNLDRIVFLFQNINAFQGDFQVYQNRIADAVRTFNNQTSWQITELIYILKDLHWSKNRILVLNKNEKKLLTIFNKLLSLQPERKLYADNTNLIIDEINKIEESIDYIYAKIIDRFSCDPFEIIQQTIKTKFSKVNCSVINNVSEKTYVKIKGYELGNIIADLVDNGIRSLDDANNYIGKIILRKNDGSIIADISDNGSGINQRYHNKIFEKGYTTRKSDGGFGLFYAKETLQKYGGEIFVLKSEKDKGTTMRIVLKTVQKSHENKGSIKNA